jgi:hypothetical protein
VFLEGGYDLEGLGRLGRRHLSRLCDEDYRPEAPTSGGRGCTCRGGADEAPRGRPASHGLPSWPVRPGGTASCPGWCPGSVASRDPRPPAADPRRDPPSAGGSRPTASASTWSVASSATCCWATWTSTERPRSTST